jgi:choline kinase
MQGLIFASGIGSRLRPKTDNVPKCLVEVNGKTLLDRMLDGFRENNIADIIITTGYQEEKIKKLVTDRHADLHITYVRNEKYDSTNYIYSLWKARNAITEDVITIHSDLIFDSTLLKKIVESDSSSVLINKTIPLPEKDFKARVLNDRVRTVGVDIFGPDAAFCLPIYKFLVSDWHIFSNKVDIYIQEDKTTCYAENAMNEITDQIAIKAIYYENEPAMEIDTYDDLKLAESIFHE